MRQEGVFPKDEKIERLLKWAEEWGEPWVDLPEESPPLSEPYSGKLREHLIDESGLGEWEANKTIDSIGELFGSDLERLAELKSMDFADFLHEIIEKSSTTDLLDMLNGVHFVLKNFKEPSEES